MPTRVGGGGVAARRGHLLHDPPESAADEGIDTHHEIAGYELLLFRFGAHVAEPVREHFAAKRLLCRAEPGYAARLSPASVSKAWRRKANRLQARKFAPLNRCRTAVKLRHWDDEAKAVALQAPPLDEYLG